MKQLIRLAVVLAMTTSSPVAHAGGEEIRACKFEVKARCVSGVARVTLADGVITGVAVDVDWCGLRRGPSYSCTIESSRTGQDSKWSDEGSTTLIVNASP